MTRQTWSTSPAIVLAGLISFAGSPARVTSGTVTGSVKDGHRVGRDSGDPVAERLTAES